VALRALNTRGAVVNGNALAGVDSAVVARDSSGFHVFENPLSTDPRWTPHVSGYAPRKLPGGFGPNTSPLVRRDRSAIIVDEWGPYDWRSPRLWPVDSGRATPLALRVLGPAGRWRVTRKVGVATVSREQGAVGDTIVVTPTAGFENDWSVTLAYVGVATVSPRGERKAAGVPYEFSYERFSPEFKGSDPLNSAAWSVAFFAWADSTDPRTRLDAFHATALRATPVATRQPPRLDHMWYRPTIPGVPQTKFAAVATTTVQLPPGTYTLRTISDDGIRVWVDGALVIDNWSLHESAVDAAPIAPGRHGVRVEYFQVDGWSELRVEIVKGAQRSPGSPGPH
jgi:hypothetical protein